MEAEFLKEIKEKAGQAAEELLAQARLARGDILVDRKSVV